MLTQGNVQPAGIPAVGKVYSIRGLIMSKGVKAAMVTFL